MLTPQEINVWYVLPAVRRELSLALKRRKLKQKEIARIIGVTEPAVSQYLKSKRARSVVFPKELQEEIELAAENMAGDKTCHRYELQRILDLIQRSGFLCTVHREQDDVPKCCSVCLQEGEIGCRSI